MGLVVNSHRGEELNELLTFPFREEKLRPPAFEAWGDYGIADFAHHSEGIINKCFSKHFHKTSLLSDFIPSRFVY